MKKKLAGALALMMLLSSLTACGEKGGASSSSAAPDADASGAQSSELPVSSAQPEENTEQPDASGAASSGAAPETPAGSAPQAPAAPAPETPADTSQPAQKPAQKPAQPSTGGAAQQPAPPAQKAPAVADVAAAVEKALAPEGEMMAFTADDLSALYGLDASAVQGFVGKMPMMNVKATEYLVVKAASGQAGTVQKAMQSRQAALDATWKQYLPDQYELVKNYKLVTNGDYVLFVVGENAQAAVDAFNSQTQ